MRKTSSEIDLKLLRSELRIKDELARAAIETDSDKTDLEKFYSTERVKIIEPLNEKDNHQTEDTDPKTSSPPEDNRLNFKNQIPKLSFSHSDQETSNSNNSNNECLSDDCYKNVRSGSICSMSVSKVALNRLAFMDTIITQPFSEYTSITDHMDTNLVDRCMSRRSSVGYCNEILFNNELAKSELPDINEISLPSTDTSSSENPARNAAMRRKSEVLKMAEEDQYELIHKLYDKNLKKKSLTSSSSIATLPKLEKIQSVDEHSE